MAKKPTKKEIQAATAAVVNSHLAAGTADQIPLETILLTLPGGAGGEAQIYACQSLKASPGMTMEGLQSDACAEADLNYSTAGWIVGRDWGDYRGFGGLGYLWERRHAKQPGDKRARWHYYLLPAGETLAGADPRARTRQHNLGQLEFLQKPGDLIAGEYYVFSDWSYTGDWKMARLQSGYPLRTFIATCYVGMVRDWHTSSSGKRSREWSYLAASGPEDKDWHTIMGSRQIFLGCLAEDGTRVAVPISQARKA